MVLVVAGRLFIIKIMYGAGEVVGERIVVRESVVLCTFDALLIMIIIIITTTRTMKLQILYIIY